MTRTTSQIPRIGDDVVYTRAAIDGQAPQIFAAKITKVARRDVNVYDAGDLNVGDFDVWLVVFVHDPPHRSDTWFTPQPVRFDAEGRTNTWRWSTDA